MLIMQSTSWCPTGWCLSMHIPSTLASTRLLPLPQSPPQSYWSKILLILAIHTPLCRIMPLHSPQRSSRHGVRERGITHLTGAPYHPATNGAAERLVQTFKQALCKSSLPPRAALQEFLMQYRRTPLADTYSPSELLNGRQIRTKIDVLLPSPAHLAQGKQARAATKSQEQELPDRVTPIYSVSSPCYALYCGPRREKDPRWVPAVFTKRFGTRSVNVRVVPRGGTWRRHIEQLRPRYVDQDEADPGEIPIQAPVPAVSVQYATSTLEDAPVMEMAQASTSPVQVAPPAKKARNP